MPNPTTRVLAVLELLQTHGQLSGSELARRLEVDSRTLRRYIATLEEIGIPLTAERGRHGGYRLVAGFKLPPMMFTNEETLALSLGLLAVQNLGLDQAAPAVASARAKLERVMPANLKPRLRALGEAATLDLPGSRANASERWLLDLAAATQMRQRVRFTYSASDGESSEREADPYGLVYRAGRWYMSGYCHLRRDLRSFRLDRMQALLLLDARFERPHDFDAAAFLTGSIAQLPRSTAVEVLLKCDLARAAEELSSGMGLLEPQEEGVLLRTRTDSMSWFARQLMKLPCDFEVREPEALREEVRASALRLLRLVETGTPIGE
ncbi:YafY family transcriptional regulator [Pseudomonas sp. DY-1]|jgi:predicted DNA-binding transcriptional regulator YafY|uniref:helix-turn-helix transcriptional regulator n=1 Tax=Pseudomonas sp. DY-1 TaxID=1755504 RepID=UPI000EAA5EFA|nr:YafY family protein [Pseudomonas sp. DY-1]AYF87814.1 YafY family transcriptional regulator [Pseudomonas sp. DY-1]